MEGLQVLWICKPIAAQGMAGVVNICKVFVKSGKVCQKQGVLILSVISIVRTPMGILFRISCLY